MSMLQQLSYFISVAEYSSFTKAAQHHFITQTAVSQQINALEQELGVRLFNRNNRVVQLTPAGNVFLKEAKLLVEQYDSAKKAAKRAEFGFQGSLKLGFLGPNERDFLPALLLDFRRQYPDVDIDLRQGTVYQLKEAVRNGALDLAFNLNYSIEGFPGICWQTVQKEPIYAIVPKNHRLADRESIRRAELADDDFVFIDRLEASYAYDAMFTDCVNAGFFPKIIAKAQSMEAAVMMVEAEIGVTTLPICAKLYCNENLRLLKLEDGQTSIELVVEWLGNNTNPVIRKFLDSIEESKARLNEAQS